MKIEILFLQNISKKEETHSGLLLHKGEVGGRKKEQAGESVPSSVEQSGKEEVEQGGKITRQGEQV